MLCLFLAFFAHAIGWGIQGFAALEESYVSAAAIEIPKVLETCHHHQHGCPKDCMCPKTYQAAEERAAGVTPQGAVREASLVACTEHGPRSLAASSDVFLPAEPWSMGFPRLLAFMKASGKDRLQDWLPEPPYKIPIAA